MKLTNLFASIITLGLCSLPAGNVRADTIEFVILNVTTFEQNTSSDNGTLTITASPKIKTYKTADILKRLAVDEFTKGNWASNSFPASARLAVVPTATNKFVVITGTNILVDVSDIISFQNGDQEIASGRQMDSTGLAAPTITKRQVGRITFDDTSAANPNGGLRFYLQSILIQTTSDSKVAGGFYTEAHQARISGGAGEGTSNIGTVNEKPFVCTGTLTAIGRTKLHL